MLFGQLPEGYSERVDAPDAILAGCYLVRADNAQAEFMVYPTGSVVEVLR